MPNPVLTEAIDALAHRQDLSAEQTASVLAEIMAGNASEAQTAAVLIALRTKGETVDELVGLATTMRLLATPVDHEPRGPHRHGGHRRRPPDVQRLHHRGADRRRGRLRGRQARQPLRHRAVGLCGPARGARRAHRPRARGGRALHRGGRLRLHVRPRPPRRHAPRRAGAQGARGAHDLQLPRAADQPRRRRAPGHRRLRPGLPRDDRRRPRTFGGGQGIGSFKRRWTGRDEHLGHHDRRRGERDRDHLLRAGARGRRARPRRLRARGGRDAGGTTPP